MSSRVVALASSLVVGAAVLAGAPAVVGAAAETAAPRAAVSDAPTPDPATRLTFFAGLPRDSKGLAAAGRKASTPGSGGYRDFLSLAQSATRYGAKPDAVKKLRVAADKLGISVAIDRTGLFARLTATVSTWERVMGTPVTYLPAQEGSAGADPAGPSPFAVYEFLNAEGALLLAAPTALASVVREFIPSATVYDVTKDIPGTPPMAPSSRSAILDDTILPWPVNTGSPLGQVCEQPLIADGMIITPSQTRAVYGTSTLEGRGYDGAKARVAIISLGGGFSTEELSDYADCFGVRAPQVDVVLGTGNPARIVSFSEETHLDLQTVAGVLGNSPRVELVQAVNDDFYAGMVDGFSRALASARGVPDAISLSYGGCEVMISETVQVGQKGDQPLWALLNDVLATAAVLGSATFTGAGDSGSSNCQMSGDPYIERPTVASPASSIWITAAGGTRLELGEGNVIVDERVWNDTNFGLKGAGGGGMSFDVPAPWYQKGVQSMRGRTTPDASALAAFRPGWPVVFEGIVQPVGGTSGSSPFQAANVALISAYERGKGRSSVGFVNPWWYQAARTNFRDITQGDNQIPVVGPGFINSPACCWAYPGYDLASGLGSPRFDRLAASLPKPE